MVYAFETPNYGVLNLLPYPKGLNFEVKKGYVLVSQMNQKGIVVPRVVKKSSLGHEIPNEVLLIHGYGNGEVLLRKSITKNALKNVIFIGDEDGDDEDDEGVELENLTEALKGFRKGVDRIVIKRG